MGIQTEIDKNNHHPGLFTLFFTEMWERFSYYGMRALLVLYLVKHLKFSDYEAGVVYGAYTGLVYLTPLLGGYLADRYLGNTRSVYIGGVFMMIGHLSLSFESLYFFYSGLLFLILGNGFFKPNISTLLGRLYDDRESLRDSAFTFFYMGINIGGSFGPLLCGYIGEIYGWHYGFSLAAIGMFLGLLVFRKGRVYFQNLSNPKQVPHSNGTPRENKLESKGNTVLLFFLAIMSIFFWIPYEQMGTSVSLYTDRYVDRNFFGFEIPASVFQSVNGFLILIFAPILAYIWRKISGRGIRVRVIYQFAAAFFLLGLAYIFLFSGGVRTGVSVNYLLLYILFLTIAELCISPVGLSTVTKLSPPQYATSFMGIWFLSNAVSHYFSGLLSGIYSQYMSLETLFSGLAIFCIIATINFFAFSRLMRWLFPSHPEFRA